MEQRDLRMRRIRTIPRHAARELSLGEWIALVLVALLGLTGIAGTLSTACWLAVR